MTKSSACKMSRTGGGLASLVELEDARRSQRDNEFRLDRLQRDLRLQGIPGL